MATPAVLESFGVDPAPLLAEFGIRPDFFADPENVLPFATMGRIFCRCVERSGCSHFGFARRPARRRLGAGRGRFPDAERAGRALPRSTSWQLPAPARPRSAGERETGGPYASLGYTILQHGVPCSEQILAGAITIGLNIMRGLCGADWKPEETHFAFRGPEDVAPYREFFGPRLRFDAEVTSIVFPSRWLDHPLPGADPLLHRRLMEERIGELELRAGEGLVAQVRRGMRALVLTPDCTLDAAARLAGMHGRTLNRRLSALGTSFFELREEARRGGRPPTPRAHEPAREPDRGHPRLHRCELVHAGVQALVGGRGRRSGARRGRAPGEGRAEARGPLRECRRNRIGCAPGEVGPDGQA
ncbi:MAG: AraC family transcriptional regulator ligand-binding domain-containing protein [Betaproteobacteria bacterium]|nr:AraC family transcriptional regulator ligand-binding domain-containing protein [Betaproteobacteria bacterium]